MMSSIEDFTKESWRVHPVLDVPELFPPAVMFSIVEDDPRPKYKDTLQRMSARQDQQKWEVPPTLTPHFMRLGLLSVSWDAVFHDVPGDRMAMVYCNEDRQDSTKAAGEGPLYEVTIGSNEPPGTKWLVTRSTQFEGKVVCWCIPVDIEKGKNTDVFLTRQNMMVLDTN